MRDKTVIPEGIYCYDEKGVCPYIQGKTLANGVIITYCKFLQEGSVHASTTEEDFDKLKKLHKTSHAEDIWNLYPLDLLWDSVKECGINEEDF